MTTLEILKEARRKIYRKKNWTQGVYARDCNKVVIALHSKDAKILVCFGSNNKFRDGRVLLVNARKH